MLSRAQQKGVANGVSFFAVSRLLIAGAILFFWGKSIVHSFQIGRGVQITGLMTPTVSEEIKNRVLTPTATEWLIEGSIKPTETPSPQVVIFITPTPDLSVVGVPVEPTPTVVAYQWYQNLYIPYVSGIAVKPDREPDLSMQAKLSYYWPPYALAYPEKPEYLINCDMVDGVPECEYMANGEMVRDYIGEAVACPAEFPFGTVFKIWEEFYTCRDRGGAIIRVDADTVWLDILYPYMPHNAVWGQVMPVDVWLPAS